MMKRMINMIWSFIADIQCGFRQNRNASDHLVWLQAYIYEAFARKEDISIFFDLDKVYETT